MTVQSLLMPMKAVIPVAMAALTVGMVSAAAGSAQAGPVASIQEVVSQPAFQRPPGRSEAKARQGQSLQNRTLLRTASPGRMQIRFNQGNRSFRMGGNASLQLNGNTIDHKGGQVIAWIAPGGSRMLNEQFTKASGAWRTLATGACCIML